MPVDDEYAMALGRALYAYNYLEWAILGRLPQLHHEGYSQLEDLAGRHGGGIANGLRRAADAASHSTRTWLTECAHEVEELLDQRNDIVHARPASAPDGRQVLYRWAPTRKAEPRIISIDALRQLEDRCMAAARRVGDFEF